MSHSSSALARFDQLLVDQQTLIRDRSGARLPDRPADRSRLRAAAAISVAARLQSARSWLSMRSSACSSEAQRRALGFQPQGELSAPARRLRARSCALPRALRAGARRSSSRSRRCSSRSPMPSDGLVQTRTRLARLRLIGTEPGLEFGDFPSTFASRACAVSSLPRWLCNCPASSATRRCATYSSRCASSRARSASTLRAFSVDRFRCRGFPRAPADVVDLLASVWISRSRASTPTCAPPRRSTRAQPGAQPFAVARDHRLLRRQATRPSRCASSSDCGDVHLRRGSPSPRPDHAHVLPACRRVRRRHRLPQSARHRRRAARRVRAAMRVRRSTSTPSSKPASTVSTAVSQPASTSSNSPRRRDLSRPEPRQPFAGGGFFLTERGVLQGFQRGQTTAQALQFGARLVQRRLRSAFVFQHLLVRAACAGRAALLQRFDFLALRVVLACDAARHRRSARRHRSRAFPRAALPDDARSPATACPGSPGACARLPRPAPTRRCDFAYASQRCCQSASLASASRLRFGGVRAAACCRASSFGSPSASAMRSVSICSRSARDVFVEFGVRAFGFAMARAPDVRRSSRLCWICCSTRAISPPTRYTSACTRFRCSLALWCCSRCAFDLRLDLALVGQQRSRCSISAWRTGPRRAPSSSARQCRGIAAHAVRLRAGSVRPSVPASARPPWPDG